MQFEPGNRSRMRTLRFRLMVWNAIVVIATAIATLVGLREGVRITLIRELDQVLSEDAREIELALANFGDAGSIALHEQLDRKDAGHAAHKWFVQLLRADGTTIYASSHAPRELETTAVRSGVATTSGTWRFYQRAINQQDNITARIGSSLDIITEDVARIDQLVAMAAGVVLVIAPIFGYWLAGRATQPLNAMIATMSQLRPARLDERLQVRGTDDELDRLSTTFNRLLDLIGNYLKERRDFLANAAHELRTPLAAIRSSIEVSLANRRSTVEYEELLGEIFRESSSLEQLVNQLLLLSETEAERLQTHIAPVRLDILLSKALDMFSGVAEHRGIDLVATPFNQATILGISQHVQQVIYNLLDNALKFTSAGGRVEVFLECREGTVWLTVSDTGIGIDPSELPLVFDRFFRGSRHLPLQSLNDLPETKRRGTGLGLSICRAIVVAHHGNVEVSSIPGRGTTFRVSFPLASN